MKNINKISIDLSGIMEHVLIFLGVVIPAFFTYHLGLKKHKREMAKLREKNEELNNQKAEADVKLTFFNQIIDVTSINIISSAVDRMFEKTKADRFLIKMAVNGKTEFNIISVIFEQHKDKSHRINAIARYHNIKIDMYWKQMLKDTEARDIVELHTRTMPETSILRDFYLNEKVEHSLIRKLVRKPIDKDNDLLVYSSIATHLDKKFTRLEKAFIKTQYEGTIIPNLEKVLSGNQ